MNNNPICQNLKDKVKALKLSRKNLSYNNVSDFVDFLSTIGWKKEKLGESFEGKTIYSVTKGKGPTKILLWSQMHGNEASSSIALMSALELLSLPQNTQLLDKVTVSAIVMLNPDGANRYTRRNAMQIDLNRDAKALTAPESKILEQHRINFRPDFAFNLHDQDIYYAVNGKSTELALLAPAADELKTITPARKKAMQVLSYIITNLNNSTNIAKYNDSFMPTAFGDHFAANAIATILIEAGYKHTDTDRQTVNLTAACAIFLAIEAIAANKYSQLSIDTYLNLPFNQKYYFFDFLIKNVKLTLNGKTYLTDIALSRDRRDPENFNDYSTDYFIWDIGDLSYAKAFETYDLNMKNSPIDANKVKKFKHANWLLDLAKDW